MTKLGIPIIGQPTVSMLGPRVHVGGEPGAGPGDEPQLLLAPGEVLDGHYEITSLLGSGGMAEVYLAFDRWLLREVAIKATSPEFGDHLEREAQVLASFQHPGLVTAHAYGRHGRIPYLVLEYLPGTSLIQRLVDREGTSATSFAVDESLQLVVGVAEALAPLHARGLVHCDLKPGNIMCATNRVVLIDFGLVWDTRAQAKPASFSGSPPFMAPEAIDRSVRPERAHLMDVYALGMILYTLLAGAPPFVDPDPGVVMVRQISEEAAPVASKRADLPPRLSAIVAALLHRDPAERPADVTSVRDALLGIPRRGSDRR